MGYRKLHEKLKTEEDFKELSLKKAQREIGEKGEKSEERDLRWLTSASLRYFGDIVGQYRIIWDNMGYIYI